MLSCVTVEKVLGRRNTTGPNWKGRIHHPPSTGFVVGSKTKVTQRICVTFPVGNGQLSPVFKQECRLIKANFDGHVRDEKGGVGTKTI